MRSVLTILFALFIINTATGQTVPDSSVHQKTLGCRTVSITTQQATPIRLRCGNTNSGPQPLFVVDGEIRDTAALRTLDPNEIANITILKEPEATAIYGCGARTGVIIIETKKARQSILTIRDFLNDDKIAAATVQFTAGNDTLLLIADENGKVVTDQLKLSVNYQLVISAVGYTAYTSSYSKTNMHQQEFRLSREIKPMTEVVVSSSQHYWRCHLFTYNIDRRADTSAPIKNMRGFSLYPNPVCRNQSVTIETLSETNTTLQVRVTDFAGRPLYQQSAGNNKSINRIQIPIDGRWTAGVYLVQVRDQGGSLIRQEKLLVQ